VKDFLSSFNEYQDGHINSLADVISPDADEDGKFTEEEEAAVAPSAPSAGLLSFFG